MSNGPIIELPSDSCFGTASMSLRRVVGVTASPFTLEEQKFLWPGSAWTLEFSLPPFTDKRRAAAWRAFAVSCKGMYSRFLLGDPLARVPNGTGLGSPTVAASGQSGNALLTNNWIPDQPEALLPGDYFQIGENGNARLYMITAAASVNESGQAVLNFEPELKISPNSGAAIIINNPKGIFRLSSNDVSWAMNPGPIWRMGFTAVEAV